MPMLIYNSTIGPQQPPSFQFISQQLGIRIEYKARGKCKRTPELVSSVARGIRGLVKRKVQKGCLRKLSFSWSSYWNFETPSHCSTVEPWWISKRRLELEFDHFVEFGTLISRCSLTLTKTEIPQKSWLSLLQRETLPMKMMLMMSRNYKIRGLWNGDIASKRGD